ncbi:MAG: hypothetical protein ACTTKL_03015 [Treponema sp.]
MKKALFLTSLLLSFSFLYGQETAEGTERTLQPAKESAETEGGVQDGSAESAGDGGEGSGDVQNAIETERTNRARPDVDFIFAFTPAVIFNTDSSHKSAPSPIVYPFGFGISVPADKLVSFQPRLSFFTNYYLYDDGIAKPAEIENRTATSLAFLLDLPAVFTFDIRQTHFFELGTGLAILARGAILSSGVDSSESGETGSAQSDVDAINKYFWKNANFLFLEASFAYLFQMTEKIKLGPEVRFYLPCGPLFTQGSMNGGMFAAGLKVRI